MAAAAATSVFLGYKPLQEGKSPSERLVRNLVCKFNIHAQFSSSRKTAQPIVNGDLILGEFSLSGRGSKGDMGSLEKKITVSVVSSISEVSSEQWNACNLDATGPQQFNPFLSHAFLSSLEESGSAVKETGWIPQHIIARDESKNVLGAIPLYLKSHSYGEYVFDNSWANAYYSYGLSYYPKLQCSIPFTPVTGPRILVRNTSYREEVFDILVSAMKDLAIRLKVSSLHITFNTSNEWDKLGERDFLQRIGIQYHWRNRNYKNFEDYLMDMKQSKRKNIRQERKKILAQNLTMKRLRGYEIKARHWDTFYQFYRNTTNNKWGNTYLTRDFFHTMGSNMGDQVLLIVAEEGEELVAGALNLIGGDTLYGRLWGCLPQAYFPNLHFEACYYQAIEAAIELKLQTVEAGAQGEHKIQRGYLPVTTYSSHYLLDEDFRDVIGEFLAREAAEVRLVIKLLLDSGPFKDNV
ncbi:unnamed protein product [Cuscuta epithymum]|uniref:Acyl-CoA N-acyltransferase n=1 Tax=Cuscuta epithymum TaxID=186058 RepID=A0AAV0FW16_9ASTE|nr:unnamed protein product [Cuscuta epithymum]